MFCVVRCVCAYVLVSGFQPKLDLIHRECVGLKEEEEEQTLANCCWLGRNIVW